MSTPIPTIDTSKAQPIEKASTPITTSSSNVVVSTLASLPIQHLNESSNNSVSVTHVVLQTPAKIAQNMTADGSDVNSPMGGFSFSPETTNHFQVTYPQQPTGSNSDTSKSSGSPFTLFNPQPSPLLPTPSAPIVVEITTTPEVDTTAKDLQPVVHSQENNAKPSIPSHLLAPSQAATLTSVNTENTNPPHPLAAPQLLSTSTPQQEPLKAAPLTTSSSTQEPSKAAPQTTSSSTQESSKAAPQTTSSTMQEQPKADSQPKSSSTQEPSKTVPLTTSSSTQEPSKTVPLTTSSSTQEPSKTVPLTTSSSTQEPSKTVPLTTSSSTQEPSKTVPLTTSSSTQEPSKTVPLTTSSSTQEPSKTVPLTTSSSTQEPSKTVPLTTSSSTQEPPKTVPLTTSSSTQEPSKTVPLTTSSSTQEPPKADKHGSTTPPQEPPKSVTPQLVPPQTPIVLNNAQNSAGLQTPQPTGSGTSTPIMSTGTSLPLKTPAPKTHVQPTIINNPGEDECGWVKTISIITAVVSSILGAFAALCIAGIFPQAFLGGMIGCCCTAAGSGALLIGSFFTIWMRKEK